MSKETPATPDKSNEIVASDLPLFRYFRVAAADFSDENTFQVRMSSEFPGEQRASKEHERLGIAKEGEKYVEILSHNEGDADLSRFVGENRAPLLDEHKDNRHLGYIKTAALSKDKTTRGVIVFDQVSKLSVTRCKQVRGDSRPNFSIGYNHTRYLGPQTLPDGRIGHRFAWEGVELSNVAVPMDPGAQKGRSKNRDIHCIRCGDIYSRAELNDDFICPDCDGAEDFIEDGDPQDIDKNEATARGKDDRMFRVKKSDGQTMQISHNQVNSHLHNALDSDKRFKTKRANGDLHSDFYIHDIHQIFDGSDQVAWRAIVESPRWTPGSKLFSVDFQYDGKAAQIGEAAEVEPQTVFHPVDRTLSHDGKKIVRSEPSEAPKPVPAAAPAEGGAKADGGTPVDSGNISDAERNTRNNLPKKVMAKTVAELKSEAPELVAQLENETRTATERSTRTATRTEIVEEFAGTKGKRAALNKEIRALADEFVKTHGSNFTGKPGAVTTVGERVRAFEQDALQTAMADETRSDSEIRSDFKQRANDAIRDSRPAKNPMEAANLPEEVASRCSLGRIMREGAKAAAKPSGRSNCFMLETGAEYEADREMRHRADEFPGGAASLADGIQLPWNMPSGVRGNTPVNRLKRDALAADFGSAGAIITPEYQFPIIELLRNFPALSRAGMTILSGLLGSPIVLPRQAGATTAQSVAEGAALQQYDQVLDQVKLQAHRIGTSQNYSRLALLQATPDFEAMVMADHMAVLSLKIDYLGLNGQGAADEPLGVLNQLIGSVPFAGSAANAFKNLVQMETAIRKANVTDDISYITTSQGRGMLKTVAVLLIGATTVAVAPIWTDGGMVNGRPAWDSQQIPNDIVLAGAFRHLVMAQWGGLAVVLDTISKADQDKYKLSVNTYVDFALRHNPAFCRSVDQIGALT